MGPSYGTRVRRDISLRRTWRAASRPGPARIARQPGQHARNVSRRGAGAGRLEGQGDVQTRGMCSAGRPVKARREVKAGKARKGPAADTWDPGQNTGQSGPAGFDPWGSRLCQGGNGGDAPWKRTFFRAAAESESPGVTMCSSPTSSPSPDPSPARSDRSTTCPPTQAHPRPCAY
jgi:hypothetical protein